ncbi:unnamed protein product [Microthlaspi erraticum]|uniref:Uncharacterized protein n=1 Tax=Microthlaspi erraticum TaxID=1685480 RepID=A0A6D2I1K3_9BRAS|nr:unnamed protein product [Microthlaspi erraticum]
MMKEDEAVTSNAMNDDDTTNIYSCSGGSDNNRIGDDNYHHNKISQVWGTWEELVLTCAVERHGDTDWDSIAKEVGSRSSLSASAPNCRLKYQDLKRRFQDSGGGDGEGDGNSEVGEITWLEELRSIRVAELRREVQRCDDSILSLQLKVKKLKEEEDGGDGDGKPDLEDDSKGVRSRNDETKPAKLNRETTESGRDDRSMNESNSTASVDHERLGGNKKVQAGENSIIPHPDPVKKAAAAEEEEEGTVSRRSGMSQSGELGESGTSTGHGRRRVQKYKSGGDSSIRGGSGGVIKSAGGKLQPLIEIIKLIRSHPRGSVFESRLRSQETKDYKRLIRQHLDIKTIEKKMEKGSYVSSSLPFYRDLKLLFTNAIVFFPPSSLESKAAQELRTLVSNEMMRRAGKSGRSVVKAEAESSVSRQKSSVPPLVVCKKKSPATKMTSPSSSLKQKDEKKSQEVSEEKTTGARSSRRKTRKVIDVVLKDTKTKRAKNNNKKQTDSKTGSSNDDEDEEESHKTEKKKKTVGVASEKKKSVGVPSDKKKSVADFLKRIKKNSPQKGKETTKKDQKKSDVNVKKENSKAAKPRELRSNSTVKKKAEVENNKSKSAVKRKQTKKEAEEVTAAATRKRGRESAKDDKQQPKKRGRR